MATTQDSALAHPVPASEANPSSDLERVSSIVPRALRPLMHSGRLQRGIALAEERFDEIEKVAPWMWSVPSCSSERTYTVNLKHATCTCPDHPPEGERCLHVSAAAYKKARTAPCSGCGGRFRHRDLCEVPEDHLTFFEEDLLCPECAVDHGVI